MRTHRRTGVSPTRSRAASAAWLAAALSLSACSDNFNIPAVIAALVPPAPPQPAPQPAPPPPPPTLPPEAYSDPEQVRVEIYRWFHAHGYKDFQVAALAEHARIESGYHPCITPHSSLRYTYQWGGLRLQRLLQFANSNGNCPPLEKQLAFADRELRTEASFSCFWRATTTPAAVAALRRGFGRGRC